MPSEPVNYAGQEQNLLAVGLSSSASTLAFPTVSDVAEVSSLIASIMGADATPDVVAIRVMSLSLSPETEIKQLLFDFNTLCSIGGRPEPGTENNRGQFDNTTRFFYEDRLFYETHSPVLVTNYILETILDETKKIICNRGLLVGVGGGAATLLHGAISAKLSTMLSLSALGTAYCAILGLAIVGLISAGTICSMLSHQFREKLMAAIMECK